MRFHPESRTGRVIAAAFVAAIGLFACQSSGSEPNDKPKFLVLGEAPGQPAEPIDVIDLYLGRDRVTLYHLGKTTVTHQVAHCDPDGSLVVTTMDYDRQLKASSDLRTEVYADPNPVCADRLITRDEDALLSVLEGGTAGFGTSGR